MRRFTHLLLGTSLVVLASCSCKTEPTATKRDSVAKASDSEGDACMTDAGERGYFVRSGDKLVCEVQ